MIHAVAGGEVAVKCPEMIFSGLEITESKLAAVIGGSSQGGRVIREGGAEADVGAFDGPAVGGVDDATGDLA
jgi:hypothetical protein